MDQLKVAILFGGCSEEHDISVKSAAEIAQYIDRAKYEPIFVGITKAGEWRLCNSPAPDWESRATVPAILSPDKGHHGFLLLEDGGMIIESVDVIFPMMHGKMGEDGQIQGILELSGIPYVGCGIQSSVLGMDKSLAHLVAKNAGVETPWFTLLREGEHLSENELPYPVFVKPARSGSSFGISKVTRKEDLAEAIKTARAYDSKVLIEQAVIGAEVGCAVMGNDGNLRTGEVDMITLSHGFFRIHQEKAPESGSENASITVPAPIPPDTAKKVKETAKSIYRALGCSGLARVDLFLQEDGKIVLNEVNTMPGCTCYSRYPRMMQAAGMSMATMIDQVITLALC